MIERLYNSEKISCWLIHFIQLQCCREHVTIVHAVLADGILHTIRCTRTGCATDVVVEVERGSSQGWYLLLQRAAEVVGWLWPSVRLQEDGRHMCSVLAINQAASQPVLLFVHVTRKYLL
jgi:hypothetical protein